MNYSPEILLVIGAAFIAGCIDAIVGGGGLIQLPALFGVYPNAPATTLLGTNKVASVFGTANAAWRFSRRITLRWRSLAVMMLLVFIGAMAGALLATHVPPQHYRSLVPIMLLVVLIIILRNRQLGSEHLPKTIARHTSAWALTLISCIGFYDGFFGPGTGSFFMFVFIRIYGYDFINAAANARVLNVMTNLAAISLFVVATSIMWQLAILMAVSNIAGSLLGTRLALRGGNQFVRRVFIVLVVALILRTAWVAVAGMIGSR